ncbi:hypothetical protein CYMTET_18610 [Cymbomonas tetramitiformis]|uniref:Uncharacterized protein n=1 Tax=Cymbomonas tetramitiformis TaxID=36881 RepID=A0AAE0G7P2_9CHLO|nr:hypothetical protein CYMTET_18610 [Cymbomonas tetramitiformis]
MIEAISKRVYMDLTGKAEADTADFKSRVCFAPDRNLTEAFLIACWTKSGFDFLAPVIWSGAVDDTVSVSLILSSVFWLTGCLLWTIMLGNFTRWNLEPGMAVAWTVSGCFYCVALQPPEAGASSEEFVAFCCSIFAAVAWLCAGTLWTIVATRALSPTSGNELGTIILWLLTGFGFLGTSISQPGMHAANRWMALSSTIWRETLSTLPTDLQELEAAATIADIVQVELPCPLGRPSEEDLDFQRQLDCPFREDVKRVFLHIRAKESAKVHSPPPPDIGTVIRDPELPASLRDWLRLSCIV